MKPAYYHLIRIGGFNMTQKIITVKTVVAIGIGAALVFVLMRFVALPSGVPNTNLNLGIAVLSVFAAVFGPIAGLLIGFIAHTLTDLTFGFGVWWTWVIADALYGLAVGLFWKLYKVEEGEFGIKEVVIFNAVQIAANILAWVIIAPTLDVLVYQEPSDKVYLQGLVAGGLNALVVLILGTILLVGYSKTRVKAGSLKAE
jgi:energy-coupling factor transport system substrate-specific component